MKKDSKAMNLLLEQMIDLKYQYASQGNFEKMAEIQKHIEELREKIEGDFS